MNESRVHGHRVLEYLVAQEAPISLSALRGWAEQAHGSAAQYHTCSSDNMTFDGLVEFLVARNKIVLQEGKVRLGGSPMCGHDEAHDHSH